MKRATQYLLHITHQLSQAQDNDLRDCVALRRSNALIMCIFDAACRDPDAWMAARAARAALGAAAAHVSAATGSRLPERRGQGRRRVAHGDSGLQAELDERRVVPCRAVHAARRGVS